MKAIKVGIVGCGGRMGRMLVAELAATKGLALAGGTEQPGSPLLGRDVAAQAGLEPAGIKIGADPAALFRASDVVIDFTTPAATLAHAKLAAKTGKALVVGTTGLKPAHVAALKKAARRAVVVQAANMSVGVNLLLGLVGEAAKVLGPDYDIEIVEMHHRLKVDAPSGTALALGAAAADGRGVKLDKVSQRVRDGVTGPRRTGDIGFATLRGGDVAGDHTVVFAGAGERVELTHKASSRAVFAKGALRAALWTRGKKPGFYTMRDVLGFD